MKYVQVEKLVSREPFIDHQRDRGDDFPRHHTDSVGERGAVEADELFGRQVGKHQRAGDVSARQRTTGQEVTSGTAVVVASRQIPGDRTDERGEEGK